MEIYLDNSATTKCSGRVREIVCKTMELDYGNPSSLHHKGVVAENYVKDAAAKIAKTLKVSEKEILFTSGGTESNNLAVIGAALANRRGGNRIVTTQIEHPSVRMPMERLETLGFEVVYLPTDAYGVVSLDALREAVNEETILVSMMQVNNEIGALEPVEEAARIVHAANPRALFHTDAVQSYGKFMIRPKKCGIDLLSASGHKIHGPKGVGFLYIREKTKIKPLMLGGGQQAGMRSGTHNVPGIAGLGEAAAEIYENFDEKINALYALKEQFSGRLSQLDGVTVNGKAGRESAPHIVSAAFSGVRSEVLLHTLEEHGIYVSAGSACASNRPLASSHTLKAVGLEKELLDSVLRFSFSVYTTAEELDGAADVLADALPKLRRYARR